MPCRVSAPDDVVVGDVHMDRLYRQLLDQRSQVTLGALRRRRDQGALPGILDHWQQVLDQCLGMPGIPLQGALEPGMLEIRQGQVHLPAEPPQARDQLDAQVWQMGQERPSI